MAARTMRPIDPISQDYDQNRRNATDRSHLLYLQRMETVKSTAEIGTAIRSRRRELGVTQDELASSIGVNRKVVGQLEKGKETVHVGIVLRAAGAVGLNVGVEPRG